MQVFVNQIDAQSIAISMNAMPGALSKKVLTPVMNNLSSVAAKKMKVNLKKVARRQRKGDRWKNTGALMASIGTKPTKVMKTGALFGGAGVRRSQQFAKNKLKSVRRRVERLTYFGLKKVPRGSVRLATQKANQGSRGQNEIRPSNYAHLVERGHGGPIQAKAYPFVEPTAIEMASYFRANAPRMLQARWKPALTQLGNRFNRTISRRRGR